MLMVACASMPGAVKLYESKTDDIKHLEMEPGWVGPIKVGLHKTNKSDVVYLDVYVRGATVATKDGLTINIDGQKQTFSSVDDLSDLDQNSFFHKRFVVKPDLVKRMVDGKSVWIKANHNGQTYEEGDFSKGGPTTARDGFIKFLSELDKVNPG